MPNELLVAISSSETVEWKCQGCSVQTKSKRSSVILPEQNDGEQAKDKTPKLKTDLETATPSQLLEYVNKKLEILYDMKNSLQDVVESVEYLSNKYDELMQDQTKLEKKVVSLENKNIYLEKYNKSLEERIYALEAKAKDKNIEVAGLKCVDGENLMTLVKKLAKNLEINPDSIREAVRVGGGNPDKRQRPASVIVQLATHEDKNLWLSKKKTRVTNGDIFNDQDTSHIYINEDLPRSTRQLLWNAKQVLKEQLKFKYVWVQGGKILARQDESEEHKKIYVIRGEEDLGNLKKIFLKQNQ